LRVTPNEWHRLGLRAEGERFTVSYDGKTLFSVTGTAPLRKPAELRSGPRPTAWDPLRPDRDHPLPYTAAFNIPDFLEDT